MQLILALSLAVLGILLFLSERFVPTQALERAAHIAAIIATLISLLLLAFYTASNRSGSNPDVPTIPPNTAIEFEYTGRVIDAATQLSIDGAKVILDLPPVPTIVYSDSEGIFRFSFSAAANLSGQVRVEAHGYRIYTRNITIGPETRVLEDIRLESLP
jgi:hypothetical protein